jgi:hypothetical protein
MSTAFRKLGLGGGGVKGILHVGALQELSKYQKLYFPDGVYGSSIGSIIATLVAFEVPLKKEMLIEYMKFDKVAGKASFDQVMNAFANKGIYSMDQFEKMLIEMFEKEGIDLRTKTLGDAKMPLFVVASNITKGKPTLFSKKVPVLDALKCSCSIPGVFRPQELYGNIYVDGDLFMPCLSQIVPDALVIYLSKKHVSINLKSIMTINPLEYMRSLQIMYWNHIHKYHKTPLTLEMSYPKLNSNSDLKNFDVEDILKHSARTLNDFLGTQGFFKKGAESVGVGSPLHLK